MKILYAASEANPFAKSGGLADVAGALPKALVKDGVDARVIMPLYGDLKYRDKLEYVTNYSVPVGWRSQYCGLFKADVDGVTYYFLDNEYYFKRRGLYGFYDDGERFAFFSRAVLETLFYIDFTPDIINCNDWQTALVPVYLNLYYRHLDKFNRIKTVFTIHNIAYLGKCGTDILEDTCGIGHRDQHIVEYDGCANFMKGAFETADKITTVSPTYAQEILDPWFSYGLDALLREKQYKLCGILNGIDMDANDPATDKNIPFNYSIKTFETGKAKCKEALQDRFGLHKDGSPVFGMVSRMVGMKGFDLVQSIADGLVDRGIQLVILGSGESQYENFFSDLCGRHPGRVGTYIGFEPKLPRVSPAAWHRWWPAATAHLPSSARPAACATPSTTAPWVTATALPLPVTTPTSCMWPAATHRMPTTTRKTGRTSCVTAWSAISAGTFPPRATRVCTTRPQTSGKRLNPKAPAGAAARLCGSPFFAFFPFFTLCTNFSAKFVQ